MDLEPLVEDVRARAGLMSREEAIGAAEATLETLGEVLEPDARETLAQRLPDGLSDALERRPAGQRLEPDEFYQRITEREDKGSGLAMAHAQAVCEAITNSLDAEQQQAVRNTMPENYRHLFNEPEPSKAPEVDDERSASATASADMENQEDIKRRGDRVTGGARHPNTLAEDVDEEAGEAIESEPTPAPGKSPQRNVDDEQDDE